MKYLIIVALILTAYLVGLNQGYDVGYKYARDEAILNQFETK